MNKDYIEGIDLALSAIEDMVEDYTKHYEEMGVTRSEAIQIVEAFNLLIAVLETEKISPLEVFFKWTKKRLEKWHKKPWRLRKY